MMVIKTLELEQTDADSGRGYWWVKLRESWWRDTDRLVRMHGTSFINDLHAAVPDFYPEPWPSSPS